MDDKTFDDQKTALDWIRSIEGTKASLRDQDIYPRLKSWVDGISPTDILEIGSGQGICSDKIPLQGRSYTGIEPSPLLLNRANELYRDGNRRFVLGSIYDLAFPDGAFDAVFSVAVWHLLSDLKKAFRELSRVLSKNGHFLIITANPSAYSLWTDLYTDSKSDGRRFEGNMRLADGSTSHDVLYLHTLDELIISLQTAGLVIHKTETFRTAEKSKGLEYFISIQGELRNKAQ